MTKPAVLALADGTVFQGVSIGITGVTTGEVVFNTAMSGYQEMLTDPSYAKQLLAFTYPHIGNVGVNAEDFEANAPCVAGMIIRDLPEMASNWRSQMSLGVFLKRHGIVAISEIDTRELTRHIRTHGAQNGCIMVGDQVKLEQAVALARQAPSLAGVDLAKVVTTETPYTWQAGSWQPGIGYTEHPEKNLPYRVVVYDFGVKQTILRLLADQGMHLTVVPATTPATDVLAMKPDGVFLSNGPGDPAACDYAIEAVKTLLAEKIPLFGICLGAQLLALASGGQTQKMKFGHHGANHPVQDTTTKKVFITSQNHGFAIKEDTLPENVTITHRSLFDNTIQGIARTDCPAFGFQGHPEASPGPHDIQGLFNHFLTQISQHQQNKEAFHA